MIFPVLSCVLYCTPHYRLHLPLDLHSGREQLRRRVLREGEVRVLRVGQGLGQAQLLPQVALHRRGGLPWGHFGLHRPRLWRVKKKEERGESH